MRTVYINALDTLRFREPRNRSHRSIMVIAWILRRTREQAYDRGYNSGRQDGLRAGGLV